MLAVTHVLVDTFACLVQPLWPALGAKFQGGQSTELYLYALWTLAGSFSQLMFGYFGDRYHWRWLIWVGPLVSITCMSCMGLAGSAWGAAGLLLLGGLGTAAFHPESATAAGECAPLQRSRALSIFYIGGYLGQAAGPYYGGWMADTFTLPGITRGIPWGLAGLALLSLLLFRRLPAAAVRRTQPVPLGQILRGKYAAMALIQAIGTLRLLVAMGVPLALAYLLQARDATKTETGLSQSMLLAGVGAGAVLCALAVGRRHERLALWLPPLGVAPLVAILPYLSGANLLLTTFAAGLMLGIAIPVLASYGQQLLPNGQRIASSWTMGVSWGLGGTLAAAMLHGFNHFGHLNECFLAFAAAAALSSLGCFALPKLDSPAL
ncbi:MAG: MFS transporter [Pirellulales bacterium]